MKRTIMAVLVAGALLLSAGSVALLADPMDGGNPDHPGVVHAPPSETGPEAVSAGSDVSGSGSDGAVIAGRKPGVGSGSTARASVGADAVQAGSKPGVGYGSDWPVRPVPK